MIETDAGSGTAMSLPTELQSPRAKLVYLYLTTNRRATVSEMAESLGMKKISLYGILKTLRNEEFIQQQGEEYRLA
ncbi:helix-turn-helix domain-containing protein [Halopenitus sp. POP-27]|uniref:helix-turn-helix domain-containing protein n=1 Tax=Halopenitus sp. POP-27 TaxID=2994425 RepID=UPI00246981F3|nr:helix-turn-helix domain-containing protein [Halopenitus sp. POP-27]